MTSCTEITPPSATDKLKMRVAAVVALLLAALCVASAARVPDDDLSNIKETLSNVGSVQVGAGDLSPVWLMWLPIVR